MPTKRMKVSEDKEKVASTPSAPAHNEFEIVGEGNEKPVEDQMVNNTPKEEEKVPEAGSRAAPHKEYKKREELKPVRPKKVENKADRPRANYVHVEPAEVNLDEEKLPEAKTIEEIKEKLMTAECFKDLNISDKLK